MFIYCIFILWVQERSSGWFFPGTERRIPAERRETYVMDLLCERL